MISSILCFSLDQQKYFKSFFFSLSLLDATTGFPLFLQHFEEAEKQKKIICFCLLYFIYVSYVVRLKNRNRGSAELRQPGIV
jgi:hypothetical protein